MCSCVLYGYASTLETELPDIPDGSLSSDAEPENAISSSHGVYMERATHLINDFLEAHQTAQPDRDGVEEEKS